MTTKLSGQSSEGKKAFKIIVIALSVIIIARVIILFGEPWSKESVQRGLIASEKMGRLIAFINHSRKSGEPIHYEECKTRFAYEVGTASDHFFAGVEFRTISDNERLERMPDVDFYLFSKDAGVGLLANGKLFYGPFSKGSLDHSSMAQDISTKQTIEKY